MPVMPQARRRSFSLAAIFFAEVGCRGFRHATSIDQQQQTVAVIRVDRFAIDRCVRQGSQPRTPGVGGDLD
jgi:hypothetical protein